MSYSKCRNITTLRERNNMKWPEDEMEWQSIDSEEVEKDFREYQEAHAKRASEVCAERAHSCMEDNNYCPYMIRTMGICSMYDM